MSENAYLFVYTTVMQYFDQIVLMFFSSWIEALQSILLPCEILISTQQQLPHAHKEVDFTLPQTSKEF